MPIPKIVAGDIVQVIIKYHCEGQQMMNVLHYRAKVGLPETEYFAVMDELGTAIAESPTAGIVPKMIGALAVNTIVDVVQCQRILSLRSPYLNVAVGVAGDNADDCDAMNVSAVITKRGELAGRGKSGTFHLGGISNTMYALGFITGPGLAIMDDIADRLNDPQLTTGGGSVFEPVIFNPGTGSLGTANPIVACTPQSTLRVVRRRTVGLGI